MTHICVNRLTITGSDNGLSPGWRQAIIGTNAGILLIGPLGTNFSENSIEILTFSFTKMRLKVSSAKWRPFCLGLNVLKLSHVSKSCPSWHIQWCHYNTSNRLVSQMQVPLAACRQPAGKLWQLCKVLYVFEHKMRYLLIHAPFTPIVVFWHISNMPT